jgi:hypothetical protein
MPPPRIPCGCREAACAAFAAACAAAARDTGKSGGGGGGAGGYGPGPRRAPSRSGRTPPCRRPPRAAALISLCPSPTVGVSQSLCLSVICLCHLSLSLPLPLSPYHRAEGHHEQLCLCMCLCMSGTLFSSLLFFLSVPPLPSRQSRQQDGICASAGGRSLSLSLFDCWHFCLSVSLSLSLSLSFSNPRRPLPPWR